MDLTTNKASILYADDDQDDIDLVTEAFDKYKANVEIIPFSNGLQLLNYLSALDDDETLPCLIILDINMPVLDGKITLTQLREQTRFDNIPVIMFSTSSQSEDNRFALAHKSTLISKPLTQRHMMKIADLFLSHCSEGDKKIIQNMRQN